MKRSNHYAAKEAQARKEATTGELWNTLPTKPGTVAGNREGVKCPRQVFERYICANRHKGSETSVAAHKRIRGGLQARREAVYREIEIHTGHPRPNGLTCDELAELWDISPNTISGRFTDLALAGRIEKCGKRPTRSGCMAAVWRVKQ